MTKRNLLLDEIVKVSLLLSSFVVLFPSTNATTNERDLYASTTSLFTQEMEQEEASDFFGLQSLSFSEDDGTDNSFPSETDIVSIRIIDTYDTNVEEGNGVIGRTGSLEIIGLDSTTLEDITRIYFYTDSSSSSSLVLFERKDGEIEPPTLWRETTSDSSDEIVQAGESTVIWYGESVNDDVGSANLIMDMSGHLFGNILDGDDSYSISTSISDGVITYEYDVVDVDSLPDERWGDDDDDGDDNDTSGRRLQNPSLRGNTARVHTTDVQENDNPWKNLDRKLQSSDSPVVDVLVVYTQAAQDAEGGFENIQALINLGIVQTNTAFANSGSEVRVQLVHSVKDTDFPDGDLDPWDALKKPNDGYFDYVPSLRTEYGADIVLLIANDMNGWCGVATIRGPQGAVARTCAVRSGKYSFAHEIGHQFNARHDVRASGSGGWNRGYIDNNICFRTVMSYNNCSCDSCPRILYFSNTRTRYNNRVTGRTTERNIDAMDEYAPTLAQLKDRPATNNESENNNENNGGTNESTNTGTNNGTNNENNNNSNNGTNENNNGTNNENNNATNNNVVNNEINNENNNNGTNNENNNNGTNNETNNNVVNNVPTVAPFELCNNNPCEANPFVASLDFDSGKGRAANLPTENKQMSLLTTSAGYYIELFEESVYSGRRLVFGHRQDELTIDLSSFTSGDSGTGSIAVNSFIVRTYPVGRVRLCRDFKCRKKSSIWLKIGSYPTMPNKVNEKELSSIVLSAGWQIEIFEEPNFGGASKVFWNRNNRGKLPITFEDELSEWNDRAKSFIISTLDN